MKLKNMTFHYVLGQSGIQGFFGEGDEYPHHKIYKLLFGWIGFSFKGMTFVAKTTSLAARIYPQASQTKLRQGYKLAEWFPQSIWVSIHSIFSGYVLNAMGIPSPGGAYLLKLNKWQKRKEPFQISFMPMESSIQHKILEVKEFCSLLLYHLSPEKYTYGVQMNVSCPNTGHAQTEALGEWVALARTFKTLMPHTPLIFKLDLTIDPYIVKELQTECDAICMGNTLAFGKLPEKVSWKKLFPDGSPLGKIFGEKFQGGLSGAPLFLVLRDWLERMEQIDPTVTIIAGGGITTQQEIKQLSQFQCVKAIALGSVAITRPWRLQGLIQYGNSLFSQKNNYV